MAITPGLDVKTIILRCKIGREGELWRDVRSDGGERLNGAKRGERV